jgi:hypothetical protein
MFKPKVSHEVPLCLLNESKTFNDYDYCLPHLLDQHEEYQNYFNQSSKEGRYIIMDNSLHELGVPYTTERLLYWMKHLHPDEFIVPDHWQDKTKTLSSAEEWIFRQLDFPRIKFVAVVQANNFEEGVECFEALHNMGYNKIAISYGASWYKTLSSHPNPNFATMYGRINFVHHLTNLHPTLFSEYSDLELHLLGCQLPQEFSHYFSIGSIKTIDTSNPILASIDNMKYEDYGLTSKPKTKIDDVISISSSKLNLDLMYNNISLFRKINNIN